ncbi:MAG: TSCPD domain-containing protein [Roseinatronobacter sp.]
MGRQKLPPRRPSITRDVIWRRVSGEHRFSVTIGLDPATGRVREVFASGARGSDMEATISDFCVTLSQLLQHGADARDLSSSMLKITDPSSGGDLELHASVLGAIAACVADVVVSLGQGGES